MKKCSKCQSDIPDDAKTCPKCGETLTDTVNGDKISLKCSECGGVLTVDKDKEILSCPYCGSKELLRSSDAVAVEKIKQQTEFKKWEREDSLEEKRKKELDEKNYKFGKFGVASIVCAVLFGIFAVSSFTNIKSGWNVLAGIIAVIGTVAFAASVVLRRGIVKTDKNYLPTVIMIAGFLLFIPFMIVTVQANNVKTETSSITENAKEFTWPDSDLAKLIPKPKSTVGEIIIDSSSSLSVDVANTSQKDFDDYISQCREKGFTENYSRSDTSYSAENKDGYSLSLLYFESSSEMDINLHEPAPKTTEKPAEEATKEAVTAPVQTDAPKTEPVTEKTPEAPAESSKEENLVPDGIVSPEFKEFMDAYEAFIDEYIDFMNRFNNSPDDLTLLADYTDYIQRMSDYIDKMDAYNEDNLSPADLAYYIEVTTRVESKLAKAGLGLGI